MFERFGLSNKAFIAIIVIVISGIILVLSTGFRTTEIVYEGNTRYTDEELTNYIFGGKYNVNTLIYYFHTSKKEKVVIPFVEDYEVEVEWPNRLKITVYEKSIIGYINYMGYHLYFDHDGVVVDSSQELIEGIPQVDGINYTNVVLHQKLEVKDDSVFEILKDLVQLCEKYSLQVDRVYISSNYDLTIYIDKITILLGSPNSLSEKMYELDQMKDNFVNLSGTLHMENFSEDTHSIIFKKDNE